MDCRSTAESVGDGPAGSSRRARGDEAQVPVRHCVAILSPSLDAVSGVSTHARMLLASDLARQFELTHFQVGREGREEPAWRRFLRLAYDPFRFALFLRRQQVELVHINTSMDLRAYWRDLVFLVVAKLMRRKVVNQIHGGTMPAEMFAGRRVLQRVLRWFLQASDAVVVLSTQELREYQAFAPLASVRQVPNAIRVEDFLAESRPLNTNDSLRLVYVARLIRDKGIPEALDALAELARAGRTMKFIVAGLGPDENGLREQAQRLGLAGSVDFVGPVYGKAKADLWRNSDIFVFPSRHKEGLPYSLLEAMAAGCVPIVTPVGGIPDVVADGKEALIVEAGNSRQVADALRTLDDDRQLLARLSAGAVRRVMQQYSLSKLGAEITATYRAVIAR